MLAICLKLLSILGILLLILLGLFLVILLLVLFYPVTYRIRGKKDEQELALSVKIKWLSGLVRVQYQYPDPGRVKLKLLCFSLYDIKIPPDKPIVGKEEEKSKEATSDNSDSGDNDSKSREKAGDGSNGRATLVPDEIRKPEMKKDSGTDESIKEASEYEGTGENAGIQELSHEAEARKNITADEAPDADPDSSGKRIGEKYRKLLDKIRKTRYTIQGIYDKIKKIWENISYYIEILREDDTKELFAHALKVMCRILKSIRPRRIKADILFGTGSPDTTGYAYGVYCMLTASLNLKFLLTPDFERKIFQGEFDLAGHVSVGVFFINGLRLLLDKKLHIFIRKIRKKTKTK